VIAATLALAAEPLPMLTARSKWSKPEKTLPLNKKQLTRKQHVFPMQSGLSIGTGARPARAKMRSCLYNGR